MEPPSVYRGFLLINALGLSEGDIKADVPVLHEFDGPVA